MRFNFFPGNHPGPFPGNHFTVIGPHPQQNEQNLYTCQAPLLNWLVWGPQKYTDLAKNRSDENIYDPAAPARLYKRTHKSIQTQTKTTPTKVTRGRHRAQDQAAWPCECSQRCTCKGQGPTNRPIFPGNFWGTF